MHLCISINIKLYFHAQYLNPLGFTLGQQVWSFHLCWPRELTEGQSIRVTRQPPTLHLGWWLQVRVVDSFCSEASTVWQRNSSKSRHCSWQRWLRVSYRPGPSRLPGLFRSSSGDPFSRQIHPMVCVRCDGPRFPLDHEADSGSQSQVDVQSWFPVDDLHEEGCVVLSRSSFLDTTPRVLWHGSWGSWLVHDAAEGRPGAVQRWSEL